jgi:hypothetical protein
MTNPTLALVIVVTAMTLTLVSAAAIDKKPAILNSEPEIIAKTDFQNTTLEEEALLKLASLEIQEEEQGIPVADLAAADVDSLESDGNGTDPQINTVREKRTLGIMSRAFCNLFYRNSVSDCPIGRRWRTDDVSSPSSSANTQNQDDFWLNYLSNNNETGTGDAVFVPTTESSYYPTATSARPGLAWLKSLLGINPDSHPIRNTFRTLFPRLYSYFGGSANDDTVTSTPRPSWWSRFMTRYRKLRAGLRGFREGWRNADGGSGYGGYGSTGGTGGGDTGTTRARGGGLDLSSLLNTIDIGALLNQIQT